MFNVLGLESVDYVNKSGVRVQGVRIHTTYQKESCDGYCVEVFYVSLDKFNPDIKLGCDVEPLYNKYGKVEHIKLLSISN